MIKVRVQLDGNQFGYITYICNETIEQFFEWRNNHCILLTEKDTNKIISIPLQKYVVEVEKIDE